MTATQHTFVSDLFDTECDAKFSFDAIKDVAKDIARHGVLPRTVHECQQGDPGDDNHQCLDVTADVAELVRDLCPDYRLNYRLFNWLQRNGAVSNAEMAA